MGGGVYKKVSIVVTSTAFMQSSIPSTETPETEVE